MILDPIVVTSMALPTPWSVDRAIVVAKPAIAFPVLSTAEAMIDPLGTSMEGWPESPAVDETDGTAVRPAWISRSGPT